MIFDKRLERALSKQHENTQQRLSALSEEDLNGNLEKGDLPAIMISATLVLGGAVVLVLGAMAAAGYFFFMR